MPKSRDLSSDTADAGREPDNSSTTTTPADAPDTEVTPLDGEEFLRANRSTRERYRSEAERKAAKAARKRARRDEESASDASADDEATDAAGTGEAGDPGSAEASSSDRTPRKLDPSGRGPRTPSKARRWLTAVGGRPWAVLLLVLATVVLAASTIGLSVAYVDADRRAEQASSITADTSTVLETARRYAAEITTYNSADYSDLDRRIRAISTPAFTQSYIESSQDARRGSTEAGAVSTATAENAGIMAAEDGRVVVLVNLDQTVKAPDTAQQFPEGLPYQSRVKVTLVQRDGRWLMDDFDVL